MSTHPISGRPPGLPEGTGHCGMAAVTRVLSLWPGWSRPKEGTRRDWTTLLSYFSQTHQSNLSLSCIGMERSHSVFLLVILSYGNKKPGEMKFPASTYIRLLTCPWEELLMTLWSCHMTSSGATPPASSPGLCITSRVYPQRRLSLSASDLQFQRDLLMLHTVLGPWGPSW